MKTRRNPWPFGVIAIFILFISGITTLVVLACSEKQDLVSPDYYEQEVRFQNHLERTERTLRAARPSSIGYDPENSCIRISLFAESDSPICGHVQFYRPSKAGLDQNVKIVLDSNGVQRIDTSKLSPGLWKVRVFWIASHKEFFLEKSIFVAPKSRETGRGKNIG